ncbi:D-cysteine desulfhydrase [Enterobacter asburiae]|uniref:D-cysteine desulfhydrase n=1 Tax=Enterobacter asburiae TaxID=61645 RepID=A0A376FKC0_ENTAS|nr:D-cysteine desulfhydrase [Enterobacter asburiae]
MVEALTDPTASSTSWRRVWKRRVPPLRCPRRRFERDGRAGYVESALEIAQQWRRRGKPLLRGCCVRQCRHACRLAVGLEQLLPDVELIGVTVSRSVAEQKPKVVTLQQAVAEQLELKAKADILLWDDYFAPGYGTPNEEGMEA